MFKKVLCYSLMICVTSCDSNNNSPNINVNKSTITKFWDDGDDSGTRYALVKLVDNHGGMYCDLIIYDSQVIIVEKNRIQIGDNIYPYTNFENGKTYTYRIATGWSESMQIRQKRVRFE